MGFVAVAFFATLAFILGAYWLFVVRPEHQAQEAVWKRLKGAPQVNPRVRASIEKQARRLSAVPAFNAVLERGREGVRPVESLIEQSGNTFTVGTFLLASATIGLVVGVLVYQVTPTPLLAGAAGLLACFVPTSRWSARHATARKWSSCRGACRGKWRCSTTTCPARTASS
jgi:Flp pilus assembly protein TadB